MNKDSESFNKHAGTRQAKSFIQQNFMIQ